MHMAEFGASKKMEIICKLADICVRENLQIQMSRRFVKYFNGIQ